ncbi:TerD family protein [Sediminitomix flava]|uniref:Tellurium resistance protein TerD n=1 Tax=Sediminitomix flava TaxID=379075 RepID=A0A315Z1L1_SEDFL|nr:TerD family protein [Sediminitomix flava]PWJ36010.1 tellurium resistance protein TerD [Sediminitomix flava]
MAISLKKGGSINLTKKAPTLKKIMIGLGWELKPNASLDLDASVFMIGENGKLPSDEYFVFYNNLKSPDGSVQHTGDNRTGAGEGDDEMILANLDLINPQVKEILITVSVHDNHVGASFGDLQDAYVRIVDVENNTEILRYDLDAEYSDATDVEFGRLIRGVDGWTFKASGFGDRKGLQGLVDIYA